jgi:hypothetical protein
MPTEQGDLPTNSSAAPPQVTRPLRPWARPLAITFAALFVISSAFPAVAGLAKNTEAFPKLWGRVDVGLAFVLAVLAFVIMALAEGKVSQQAVDATYRAYRILIHGIIVMLVVFFLAGDRIVWINCLTGLAWRAWLLAYCLPAWFAAFGMSTPR